MRHACLADWLDWQQQLHTSSIDLGLERIRVVARRMQLLGRPDFRIVTVAGTNGKGSSVALLEAMLRPQGRVGAYTSPHFLRYNERVRIDGQEIDDASLCAAFEQVERARGDTSLSFFEYGTLATLSIFQQQDLDYAILEVGLGGRMDAVNLWDADVALITSISIDHTEWLGRTREAIGREKAGIMRPGRPVVCSEPEPPASLPEQARRLGAPMQRLGRDFFAQTLDAERWRYHHRDGILLELPLPHRLPGAVQLNNAAGALSVLHQLDALDLDAVHRALQEVQLIGRFQVLAEPVDTVLDIAHNPEGAANLARNLRRYRAGRPLHAVFSALQEKDVANMMEPLNPLIESWHLSAVDSPRAMPLQTLQLLAESRKLSQVQTHACLADACQAAGERAGADGTVVVFGSVFAIGEFLLGRADQAGATETLEVAGRTAGQTAERL